MYRRAGGKKRRLKTLGALRSRRFSEFIQVLALAVCFASQNSRKHHKSVQINL